MDSETREEWFFKNSQNRAKRRKMAKLLGYMKDGWQEVSYNFPPVNTPKDLGIQEFKRVLAEKGVSTSDKNKAVLKYKMKAYEALVNSIKPKEA